MLSPPLFFLMVLSLCCVVINVARRQYQLSVWIAISAGMLALAALHTT